MPVNDPTQRIYQIHPTRWHWLPLLCLPGAVLAWILWNWPAVAVGLLVASPIFALLVVLGWQASVQRIGERLEIRAGAAAATVMLADIDRGSVQILDNDLALQLRLQRHAGVSLGAFRYGWYSRPNEPKSRYFLASNARHVLAFSTGGGGTHYRISLTSRSELERLLAELLAARG